MSPEERISALEQENRALREQLAQRDEVIAQLQQRLQTLEGRLRKDSHNSHLPSSADRFVRQPKSLRPKSGKQPGGQPNHPGHSLSLSLRPDEVVVHALSRCQHCEHDLQTIPARAIERRQVVDIPSPALRVVEHQSEQKQCPHCQQISLAPFPEEVRAPVQYGTRIGAIAVYLVQQQLLPLARATEVMADLLGVSMSEGTLCTLIARCAGQLELVEERVKAALKQAPVIHQDETGCSVAGKRHWMHVTCTATLTHYQVHVSRGQKALEAIGILPGYAGISIHDGWGSYFLYGCEHASCNVHLLRDLTFLAEEQGLWWAAKLKALLLDMKEATQQARTLGKSWLDPLEVADWEARFLELLAEGDQLHPHMTAPPGTRGRCKQSAARNLLDRLRKQQEAVLRFLEDLRVDFDNNQAERDLRMVKVQQKVSGCFRALVGAEAFARIRGYLSTLRKQGLPLLAALEATLQGHPLLPSFQTT
jgi:transposase